jgi:hypothetical protein
MRNRLPLILMLAACDSTAPDIGAEERAVASVMGGVEWSIDAPWRLEPPYGQIPITISFHDGSEQKDPESAMALKRFCSATIVQLTGRRSSDPYYVQQFPPERFHEIESHAKWPYSSDVPAFHRLARVWNRELPSLDELDVSLGAEWSGTLMYTPNVGRTEGNDVYLQVTAVVSDTRERCPPLPSASSAIGIFGQKEEHRDGARVFRQVLKVHYGHTLPKFDGRWVYGDLHYHSQGTDNEGESALPFRAVLQSMKAMGLDFVFATDHASYSGQVTDLDSLFVTSLPDWIPSWAADWITDAINTRIRDYPILETAIDQLRDLSPARFAHLLDWLHGRTGANQDVLSSAGMRAPQLFLGAEVDVIPEMSVAEKNAGKITFGNNLTYDWRSACTAVPSPIREYVEQYTSFSLCPSGSEGLVELASEGGRYLIRDVQGIGSNHFARQHLLHLPTDPTRADAFVASQTTQYGGAFRRLKDVIAQDYTTAGKGVFFLAHPVSVPSGNGPGRMGPDILPFTDMQLRTAFDSQHFLGLQLWNEDDWMRSETQADPTFPLRTLAHFDLVPDAYADYLWNRLTGWGERRHQAHYRALHHGAKTWDRMLLWGITPSMRPAWLASGAPRKVFMAGGSDAHGDLNHRRWGAIIGTMHTTDTAIGTPRNLVHVGSSRPVTVSTNGRTTTTIGQTQVVGALQTGNFAVTDGPAIRIAIDRNQNGVIDDADVPMGGAYEYSGPVPLLVEWKSTPEFGPVTRIDLYVGVNAGLSTSRTYAPSDHGVRASGDPSGTSFKEYPDSTGRIHRILGDGYVLDPSGKLRITPTAKADGLSYAYQGTRHIWLSPSAYPAFTDSCAGERVCEPYDPELGTPPICEIIETCSATFVHAPERLYVRALARSASSARLHGGTTESIQRLGFANPIWLKPNPLSPPSAGLDP